MRQTLVLQEAAETPLEHTAETPLERVEAELCTLAGQIAAATCRFLTLLADFDARQGWAGWNVRSCAHWLSWRCGLDLRTAREYVRVARALAALPVTAAAFGAGRISYSKVRAIARVATPQTEADLVEAALHAPAAHLERLTRGIATARRYAAVEEGEPPAPIDAPRLRWRWDDDGTLVLWGRLPAEQGAQVLAALARADEVRREGGSAEPHRRAETLGDVVATPPGEAGPALVTMAALTRASVDAPVHAPVADVVVHVSAATLAGADEAEARLDDGPAVTAACARRLACDGRVQLSVEGSDGRTLDVGRWRRRPTAAQKVALWRRDRGCAVPGCSRTRFLHAHHVRPWARGGRTSLDNMVLLCGDHHRALHDGEFSIVALGRQRFRFRGPGGAAYPAAPAVRGAAGAVAAAHPDIRPDTIEPDWVGDPLDEEWGVSAYLQTWEADERARRAAAG